MPTNQDFSPLIQAWKKSTEAEKNLKKVCLKKQLMSDKHGKSAKFGHHQRHQRHSIPSFAKFLLLHLVLISLTHPFKDHVCKGKFWQSSSAHWGQKSLWSLISNLLLLWFHKMFWKDSSLKVLIGEINLKFKNFLTKLWK